MKKSWVAILISDKIDFRTKAITRDKGSHYIILKGVVQQEDVSLVNKYALKIGAPKYIRKILDYFKKDIDSNTLIVGDFNTPFSTMDRFLQAKNQQRYCGIQ